MNKTIFAVYFATSGVKKAVLVAGASKKQVTAYARLAFRVKLSEFTVLVASAEQVLYAEKMHLKIHDACISDHKVNSPEVPSKCPTCGLTRKE